MATIRVLLGIVCLTVIGWNSLFGGSTLESEGVLVQKQKKIHEKPLYLSVKNTAHVAVKNSQEPGDRRQEIGRIKNPLHSVAKKAVSFVVKPSLISIAKTQIGVREKSGRNDGEQVEVYLKYVGTKKGAPWCAAFVSWVFGQGGYNTPRTAWSPALFPLSKRCTEIKPATVFGIYFQELRRIAHCGLVESNEGQWLITIEGNTNVAGSREGDGVYRKRRSVNSVRYFARWNYDEAKHGIQAHMQR